MSVEPLSQVEQLLRAWGLYYGERPREASRGERTEAHPIAQSMSFAPGKRDRRQAQGRAGEARRRIMGRAAGLVSEDGRAYAISAAYVDPVPCRETRSGPARETARPVPPELQRVESTAKALEEQNMLRGLCLRAHYCIEGDRAAKADWVTREIRKAQRHHAPVTVNQLKNEAAFGRVWMEARLSWAPQPMARA